MAVLQNKLVWKSIEALHEEAVEVLPQASTNDDFVRPASPAVSHDCAPETQTLQTSNGDVIARIDRLLRKLDEDETNTAELLTPTISNHLSDAKRDNYSDKETVSVKKGDNEANEISSNILNDADQDDALADIATAIREAQKNPSKTILPSKNQDASLPFDMDSLSTTIANEVRQVVSQMLASEMPNVVRQAVDESIKENQTNLTNKPETTTVKKTRTKSRAKQKTQSKKTVKKRPSSDKSATKKLS